MAGPDVGGFSGDPGAELFARWFEVGCYFPFFRGHADKPSPRKEPWSYGEAAFERVRASLRWRMRLLPFLQECFQEAHVTGVPVMRPLFFADPAHPDLRQVDDAFMLGPDLLVVPALEPDTTYRDIPLPAGSWRRVPIEALLEAGTPSASRDIVLDGSPEQDRLRVEVGVGPRSVFSARGWSLAARSSGAAPANGPRDEMAGHRDSEGLTMRFPLASMSPVIRGLTWFLLAIPTGLAIIGAPFTHPISTVAGILVGLYAIVWLYFRPSEFRIEGRDLVIAFPVRERRIRLDTVRGARVLDGPSFRREYGWGMRFGAGGLWGGFGWLYTRKGWLEFYVSRLSGFVVVEFEGTLPLLITPDRTEAFARAISRGPRPSRTVDAWTGGRAQPMTRTRRFKKSKLSSSRAPNCSVINTSAKRNMTSPAIALTPMAIK